MHEPLWSAVKNELRGRVGGDNFRNWIEPIDFIGIEGQSARFAVPSKFFANWVEKSYGKEIQSLFWSEGGAAVSLDFEVASQPVPFQPVTAPIMPARKTLPDLPSSPLDPRYRFDRFIVGKSNELAYNASQRVAGGDGARFNPLFLYSGSGLGKTHLMHAIAWDLIEANPNIRVLYLSAEQFMYRFVSSLRNKDMHGFKEVFRSVDVLLVDDVQFISGKDNTQEEFFYTFNALVEQNKQVIISADRAPGDLEGIEERIRSRLQSGLMVDIHPTNFELRLGILQSKAEHHYLDYPDLVIEDGVLEFLAQRISSNVRVLEGALTRLVAYHDLTRTPVSLEMAYETLADILRVSQKKVTLEIITKTTAEFFNLRISDLTGKRRTADIARARQIAMYLAKNLTTKSLPDIGRAFGGRDHSTVIHAVRKIDDLIVHDSSVAEDIETLRRRIEA